MDSVLFGLTFLVAGVAIGGVAVWLVIHERLKTAEDRARGETAVELATLRERVARLPDAEADAKKLREARDALQLKVTELSTILDAQKDKLAFLTDAKEDLAVRFKNLANEILEDKSRRFAETNKQGLETLLNPLREKIGEFQVKVEQAYDKESRERLTLQGEIKRLAELNAQISADAVNLTRALKGDSKTQGTWGELVLEKVLESSGLRLNEEYVVQKSFLNEEDRRSKPDVVVNLPEKRHVVIDSKVSLTAYDRYIGAEDDAERQAALRQHVLSVRSHIMELSAKNYQNLYGLESLDFVFMFLPVESACMLAMQSERDLFLDALRKNVLIVSPSSLIGVLRTIAHIWRQEQQNRNAKELVRQCALLYDKFVGFVADLDDIGRKLKATHDSYEAARSKLSTGKGNLIRQAERIRSLGVKPTKALPAHLVDEAVENAESDLDRQLPLEDDAAGNVVQLTEERKGEQR
ncbi:MAG TPA: DNA recombination protein RmuC [Burkholderiales bacterium]|nr:DNA recombination protein RmuC [Burkholderiales bacterium]